MTSDCVAMGFVVTRGFVLESSECSAKRINESSGKYYLFHCITIF